MFIVCCVGINICDGRIACPEESYQLCVSVCDVETIKEAAYAQVGFLCHQKKFMHIITDH